MSTSNNAQSSSSSLEPTLYTQLPPSLHPTFTAHLSLHSIHIEESEIIDRIYTTSNPIIQGQLRNLRFRSSKIISSLNKGKGKGKLQDDGGEEWIHSLSYVSSPLRSQEYSEASTRAVIGLDILSLENVQDVEDFIESLGFDHSHTYISKGSLFHIPIPIPFPENNPITLQLSMTHLTPLANGTTMPTESNTNNKEPWLIQLYPSRPVNAVSINGDLNYSSLVEIMSDFVGRLGVGGLNWSTGR